MEAFVIIAIVVLFVGTMVRMSFMPTKKTAPDYEQNFEVQELHEKPGDLEMMIKSGACIVLADHFAELLDEANAPNLLEMVFYHKEKGPIVVQIRRKFGKSDMELRNESEDCLSAARGAWSKYVTYLQQKYPATCDGSWEFPTQFHEEIEKALNE